MNDAISCLYCPYCGVLQPLIYDPKTISKAATVTLLDHGIPKQMLPQGSCKGSGFTMPWVSDGK